MIWPLLRTRRWIGFTAVVIAAIVGFGLLSAWQWGRADTKRIEREDLQAALDVEPAPLSGLGLWAAVSIPAADQWRAVEVTGRYDTDRQAVVRKKPLDTRNGFWVMTALQDADGRYVWVNRGWMPAGQDALSTPAIPPAPAGEVTVTGYLRAFEEVAADANTGLPAGQVAAPAAVLLPETTGTLPGYLQLSASQPAEEELVPVPLPAPDEGRNVSYAIQWALFAAIAVGGWFFFLRREAIEDAQRTLDAQSADAGTKGA